MAYTTIDSANITVGSPLKKELFDLVKSNFDDHETRILALGAGSGKISLVNTDIRVGSTDDQFLTGALYYEVIQDCIVTECAIQLFEKSPATTGSLTVDIKKNTTTNPSGFNTIMTTPPTLNVAVASDYQRATGTVNPSAQSLVVGNIIRVDITGLPSGLQRFRVVVIGEF